jgi:hypothetical protein
MGEVVADIDRDRERLRIERPGKALRQPRAADATGEREHDAARGWRGG